MTKILALINLADQFLKDRDWWQFHNPKNDSINLVVEVGELAELFIESEQDEIRQNEIANELADVLFGLINFTLVTKIDLVQSVGSQLGDQGSNQNLVSLDDNVSYYELSTLVLQNLELFNLAQYGAAQAIMLSLVRQATLLADLFIWSTVDESEVRAQLKQGFIVKRVAAIFAHLVFLADILKINLPDKFLLKMDLNAQKYPANLAFGNEYVKIKDKTRN